jgi:hypothetical protein
VSKYRNSEFRVSKYRNSITNHFFGCPFGLPLSWRGTPVATTVALCGDLRSSLGLFLFCFFLVLVTNRKAQKTCSLSLSLSGAAPHSQGGGGGEGVCLLVILRAGVGARARASLWKRANKIWLLQYPCSRVRFRSSAYRKFVCSTCVFWSPSCSSRVSSACALTSSASVDRSILPKHS